MADISKEIQDFREAVYGEEVRGSMISLAEKVNAESEDSAKKVTEYGKAEASRAQAETARVNAEEARVTAEKGRVSAEKTRVSAESTRADNEDGRIAAEDGRADAEAERVTAETERASAETSRVSAETKRASAETKRINAEKARATAEEERASEETGRVNAESARVTAETNRQKNTAQAIEDCDNAATRANAAAEAAEGIVDGTGLVTVQEKGAANGVATLDENTKIPQSQIDGNNIPITFETAIERANIQSGDTLAVAFGKLSKFCADLQPHAFAAPVNNLTGTDASLPLAAPQGKVLKAEIDELKYFTSIAPTGASNFEVNKNMLLVDAGNVNGESNKSGYFSINDSNRSEWRGLSSLMPQSGGFIGFREVYPKQVILDKQHILIKITEMYPVSGRQYFCFYNYGSWGNWTVISPTS